MTENFLLLTLFFPRIGLLVWYLNGWIPFNITPFWLDVMLSIFLPRILILVWIGTTMGFGGWFIAHLVFAIIAYSSSAGSSVSNYQRS